MDVNSLARNHTERAIQVLAGIMDSSPDDNAKTRAATVLLDRGWGRPNQPHDAKMSGELKIVIRKMLTEPEDE